LARSVLHLARDPPDGTVLALLMSKEESRVVIRFDPFRDVDRLAERLLSSATDMGHSMRALPMDVYRSGDQYVIHCDLPGADPGSVDVSVDGRSLTIRAQRSSRSEDVDWLTQERTTGVFVRQLNLGPGLDLDRIDANYTDGVLTLTIPVAEQAKPRKIDITHAGGQTQLGTTASRSVG
jgi:HSP20 family protein